MKKSIFVKVIIIAAILVVPPPFQTRMLPTPGILRAAMQPPRPAQEEFVPIDQLPPEEQLPAAPLLVAAYGFVWIALLFYLWSIWRRMGRVERELADVGRRVAAKGRGA
jgi:CcmD family protein